MKKDKNNDRRKVGHRHVVDKTILIFCEGHTETRYFKSISVDTRRVKVIVKHIGKQRKKLVEDSLATLRLRYKEEINLEVWCVFDMDFEKDNRRCKQEFKEAIDLANKHGFKLAYSNDSFELWLVLHYRDIDVDNTLPREECNRILSERWNCEKGAWKKAGFSPGIYERLESGNQAEAIRRARTLFNSYHNDIAPADQNPCTTVYQLIEKLNQYPKYLTKRCAKQGRDAGRCWDA